ncbi:hypothetical protein C2W62_40960 [Candidatus Entotheonella serta]|nr:hypothetical protein C2W62_40960 [Candidatus Entotheonella serta]
MRSHGVLPNGEAIRQFRRLKGWAQEELAAKSNCSKTTIGRLETGVQRVHLRTLRQVAHAFDIAVEDLFISEPVQSMPLYSSSIVPVGSLNHTIQAALAQQSTWNLTYRRNLNFVGRESLLTALRDAWASNPTVPQVLSGLGGIGKTQLALEYAYRYASHYPTVLWVQADTAMT